jgi:hypothetical protein
MIVTTHRRRQCARCNAAIPIVPITSLRYVDASIHVTIGYKVIRVIKLATSGD